MVIGKQQGSLRTAAVIIFILLVAGLVVTNVWLRKMAGKITSKSASVPKNVQKMASENKRKAKINKIREIIRRTYYSPDRKYEVNVFYRNKKEIARNKFSNGEFYDQSGKIPDGKVVIIDETDKTYGEEYYRDQKRHGPATVYYSDSILKQETYYQYGKKMTHKEYFHDGIVRMEEDYTNAREMPVNDETGVGKVYSRDGKIKYEWHLTITEPIGFKKSYNRSGKLVGEFYYDESGELMDSEDVPPVIDRNSPKQIFIPTS